MTRRALALLLLLGGCQREAATPRDDAGSRLERAAVAAGIVADPSRIDLTGAWARETDRLCIVPGQGSATDQGQGRDRRIGVLVDSGEGQGCAASGTLRRRGEIAAIAFGACRFDARIDGEHIVFPAELPATCDSLCTGRASLSALSVDRVSASASEAAQLRTPSGRALCGS